jgi:septal ring-binding cell division protein DamX
MGYTSKTTMEDRGLRDIERWRDKIEVRLDNRQVFFLFFGSALVACMLFVLGVIVGKRLESRGRAITPEIEDPLALLDKMATTPRAAQTGVTFPQTLFGNSEANSDKHGKKSQPPAPVRTGAAPSDKAEAEGAIAPVAVLRPAPLPQETRAGKAESKPAPQPAVRAPDPEIAAAAKPAAGSTKPQAEPKASKPVGIPTITTTGEKGKGRFALQLSSFPDKSEAEAFARKFESERPYMVVSDIPGKGTWYRVRVGDYPSAKDAMAAKESFEKKHNVIAYVAQN